MRVFNEGASSVVMFAAAELLRPLQLPLQPASNFFRFQRVGAVAFKTLERARSVAARRQRQSQISPTVRASRSLFLSHRQNIQHPQVRKSKSIFLCGAQNQNTVRSVVDRSQPERGENQGHDQHVDACSNEGRQQLRHCGNLGLTSKVRGQRPGWTEGPTAQAAWGGERDPMP
jgi:hypothetical protein